MTPSRRASSNSRRNIALSFGAIHQIVVNVILPLPKAWLAVSLLGLGAGLNAAPLAPGLAPDVSNEGQPIALPAPVDGNGNYARPPEAVWPNRKGETIVFSIADSPIYPGTVNEITVYVPSSYTGEAPACLYVRLDKLGDEPQVYENLIARHEVPMTILVGIAPGTLWRDQAAKTIFRYNRTYEFDSTNDNFPRFLETEVLPAIERRSTSKGIPIQISPRARDRAIGGASTGGVGAFTVAWRRPDLFSRVFSTIGTFVAMRGGDEYPSLIRKTEPKPIRIFLEDGDYDAWNPLFGSWYLNNLNMDAALRFAGYDEAHLWGHHGHDGRLSNAIMPAVMRWLWRGWPGSVAAGTSSNDLLKAVLVPAEGWQACGDEYRSARALAADRQGGLAIADAGGVAWLDAAGERVARRTDLGEVHGLAFTADGTLYASAPRSGAIVAFAATGEVHTVAKSVRVEKLAVDARGVCYATEPGTHSDEPSRIVAIGSKGGLIELDRGISSASGLAVSPDGFLLLAAEPTSQWIYSFAKSDRGLAAKQRYFWLHTADIPNSSGATELAYDTQGDLWVASEIGIQVCDRNGRVRAILPFPTARPVTALCFGGPKFDTVYATDGRRLFRRKLAVRGYLPWMPPITLPPFGAG